MKISRGCEKKMRVNSKDTWLPSSGELIACGLDL